MPPATPHDRKVKPGEVEEEGEDLVDQLIEKTGCSQEHYRVQVMQQSLPGQEARLFPSLLNSLSASSRTCSSWLSLSLVIFCHF